MLAFVLVVAIGVIVGGSGNDGMVGAMCMGLLWGDGDDDGVNWLEGRCVLRWEWCALMRLSCQMRTFNMCRLHA